MKRPIGLVVVGRKGWVFQTTPIKRDAKAGVRDINRSPKWLKQHGLLGQIPARLAKIVEADE